MEGGEIARVRLISIHIVNFNWSKVYIQKKFTLLIFYFLLYLSYIVNKYCMEIYVFTINLCSSSMNNKLESQFYRNNISNVTVRQHKNGKIYRFFTIFMKPLALIFGLHKHILIRFDDRLKFTFPFSEEEEGTCHGLFEG